MPIKIAPNALALGNIAFASGSVVNTSLSSAYVHTTSGAGVAIRFNARDLTAITEAYIYISTYTGTAANVTMRARVYNENPTVASRPGTTLLATSSTTTLPAASGWARFEFDTPYSPANVGEYVWIVFDNTAAVPATNFPNIRTSIAVVMPGQSFIANWTTTGGFSAAGTRASSMPAFFVQGGATRGLTQTVAATPVATNTRPRGLVLKSPVDATVEVLELQSVGSTITNIKIWDSTQLPNDTPIYQFATGGTGRAVSEIAATISFEPPFIARANITYYICWDFSGNNTSPICLQTQDYTTYSSVFDQNVDNFTLMPLVRDNGSNVWVIENNNHPRVQLILGDLSVPTITSAS